MSPDGARHRDILPEVPRTASLVAGRLLSHNCAGLARTRFVAIDSTISGRARGGLRIASDVTEAGSAAPRAMTLKYGLLGLPQGEAQGRRHRRRRLAGRGEAAPPASVRSGRPAAAPRSRLPARCRPGDDGGRHPLDDGVDRSEPEAEWRQNRSAEHTARSCLTSADVVLEMAGGSLAGSRVAIEGFRKVGSPGASCSIGEGRGVVAVSTSRGALHRDDGLDVNRLVQRARQAGSCFVERARRGRKRMSFPSCRWTCSFRA